MCDVPLVSVQVYYNPWSDAAINFIKSNAQGGATSIYDLMVPDTITGRATGRFEVDFIPWGTSTRETVDGKVTYKCAEGDDNCQATRLHVSVIIVGGVGREGGERKIEIEPG